MQAYEIILKTAVEMVINHPSIGTVYQGAYRKYRAGKHVIYYTFDETTVHIVRILHEKMDAQRQLH